MFGDVMKSVFFIILTASIIIAGCMDCGGINARYGGMLENEANHYEHVYLSNADLFLSGTFSVDTHNSVNGSVFGTSGDIIRGKYSWQGENLTLIPDNGNRYVFTKSGAEVVLISGFENSKDPVNQFSYLHAIPQC
jgi:hypothetical protein